MRGKRYGLRMDYGGSGTSGQCHGGGAAGGVHKGFINRLQFLHHPFWRWGYYNDRPRGNHPDTPRAELSLFSLFNQNQNNAAARRHPLVGRFCVSGKESCPMARAEKFVPLEKRSKKEQKAYHAQQRGSWNGVNPVTRVVPNKKVYDRKRAKARRYDPDVCPLSV